MAYPTYHICAFLWSNNYELERTIYDLQLLVHDIKVADLNQTFYFMCWCHLTRLHCIQKKY